MDTLEVKIKQLKAGDNTAFDYIYERTYKTVYFKVLYIVRNKFTAEDIVQQTYLNAITNIGYYQEGTNFLAWISRIARNLALNDYNRNKRMVLTDFSKDDYKYGVDKNEKLFIFELAKNILSAEEFEIIMLTQVAGYKRREVAAMLDMPIGTVTWKNNEALKKLKYELMKGEKVK